MPDIDTTVVQGVEARGYRRGAATTDGWDQFVVPVRDRVTTFVGRSASFVTPGRAAVTQRLIAIHNVTGSTVLLAIQKIRVDLLSTAAAGKAPTIVTPIIRLHRFTGAPTGGTTLPKAALDTAGATSASVVATGDASADGTLSATALAFTPTATLAQVYAPRLLVVGTSASTLYEPVDTAEFLKEDVEVTLRAGEGLGISLDAAVVTTGNPATDRWLGLVEFEEFTRP